MKVFGIGLNKTGTTTLGECCRELGFRHASFNLGLLRQIRNGELDGLRAVVDSHDSFEDWPYPLVFEQLDHLYPGSVFILTRRKDPETWLRSLEAHSLRTDPTVAVPSRRLAYGWPYPQLNRQAHLSQYSAHLQRVRDYFKQRPGDLLELCWEEEARWQPLCDFLERPVPAAEFPHANRRIAANPALLEHNQEQLQRGLCDAAGDDAALPG